MCNYADVTTTATEITNFNTDFGHAAVCLFLFSPLFPLWVVVHIRCALQSHASHYIGELEGLAMTADPGFNLISVVYPYVCRRLLTDPSPSLRAALKDLIVAEDGSVRW